MKSIQKDFYNDYHELKVIINASLLREYESKDEYDNLTNKILSHLYKGANAEKIHRILDSDLTSTHGFFKHEFDSEEIVREIWEWWTE